VKLSHKTEALYRYVKVFEKIKELAPWLTPSSAMADFEEASVTAFRQVFGDVNVTGCWFHYTQPITKRVQKLGLKDEYVSDVDVKDIVRCLFGSPLLPASEIRDALF